MLFAGRVFEIKRGEHMLRDFCAALGLSVKPAGGLQCRRFARTEYGRKTSLVPDVSQLGRKMLKRKAPEPETIDSRSQRHDWVMEDPVVEEAIIDTSSVFSREVASLPPTAKEREMARSPSTAKECEITRLPSTARECEIARLPPTAKERDCQVPQYLNVFLDPGYLNVFLEQQTTYKTPAQQATEIQAVLHCRPRKNV